MSGDPLPLAEAQRRLCRPGRPKKASPSDSGDAVVTRATVALGLQPRLLDRPQAARYLNLSVWSLIDLEAAGLLARVRIGEVRRVLYDVKDLDKLIEASK